MIKINLTVGEVVKTNLTIGPSRQTRMETTLPYISPFATYIYDQMVASDLWIIVHNLNCYPSVSIIDTGGNVVIGDVRYISNKEIHVSFSNIFSGKVYLN